MPAADKSSMPAAVVPIWDIFDILNLVGESKLIAATFPKMSYRTAIIELEVESQARPDGRGEESGRRSANIPEGGDASR